MERRIKIDEGGMWEESWWELYINHECTDMGGGMPCKHCYDIRDEPFINSYGEFVKTVKHWICPGVVVAKNEGGYDSTGICFQCIIEHGTAVIIKS